MCARWPVKVPPGGALNDYVPFYFTPFSVMMHNINTGWSGVTRHPKKDILILVSSLRRIQDLGLAFLFTDSHANIKLVKHYNALLLVICRSTAIERSGCASTAPV